VRLTAYVSKRSVLNVLERISDLAKSQCVRRDDRRQRNCQPETIGYVNEHIDGSAESNAKHFGNAESGKGCIPLVDERPPDAPECLFDFRMEVVCRVQSSRSGE
jgi:hypothetical protein